MLQRIVEIRCPGTTRAFLCLFVVSFLLLLTLICDSLVFIGSIKISLCYLFTQTQVSILILTVFLFCLCCFPFDSAANTGILILIGRFYRLRLGASTCGSPLLSILPTIEHFVLNLMTHVVIQIPSSFIAQLITVSFLIFIHYSFKSLKIH